MAKPKAAKGPVQATTPELGEAPVGSTESEPMLIGHMTAETEMAGTPADFGHPPYPTPTVVHVRLVHPDAKMPTKGTEGAAGFDLYAAHDGEITGKGQGIVDTGIEIAVPEGYAGLIWARSGLSAKNKIIKGAGVIDSDYRGKVMVVLFNLGDWTFNFKKGDRIAQILFQRVENLPLVQSSELPPTKRGSGGFGSTGA